MVRKENAKFNKEKDDLMKIRIDKLIVKHQNERNNLKQKLDYELNKLQKNRKNELDTLSQKYKNKKQNLENQQKNEKILVTNGNIQKASNIMFKL